MIHYILRRLKDISGTSGIGDVAHATVFPNGLVALSFDKSRTIFLCEEDLFEIHGHGGNTIFVPTTTLKTFRIFSEDGEEIIGVIHPNGFVAITKPNRIIKRVEWFDSMSDVIAEYNTSLILA